MGVLDGKAAIVTGSARGIGRATAELLAEQGARVLINDLDGDVAEQAASRDPGRDRRVRRRPDQAGRARPARPEGVDEFGQIDIIVNNAGYTWDGVDPQDDRRAVPGDARHPHGRAVPGPARRRAAPARAGQEGARGGQEVFRKIVNVSSISARWATPARPTTRPPRPAVVGLTKTLAKEWGQFKINVNAVAFGFVETRLTAAKEEGDTMTRRARRSSSASPSRCARWRR